MLDIRLIRQDPQAVNDALQRRSPELSINEISVLDEERLKLLQEEEVLRSERNVLNKEIATLRQSGQNADAQQAESKAKADRIKAIEERKDVLEAQQNALLMMLPNMPHPECPTGTSEDDNVVVRTWGQQYKNKYPHDPMPHFDIGTKLGIIDFERGVKIAQSRFSVLVGAGAKLERALINFMLDMHSQKGYTEYCPPFLVNRKTMTGTGQLPKFEQDMFQCKDDELFLIPTAEVPLTNLFQDEILGEDQLPMYMMAYTPCFRREAGSAGKDTRGLIRQHQFDKIELVKLVHPERSQEEHLSLLQDAEAVLQALNLPYRVIELCSADIGFAAARCFDIEVWMPAQGVYREISSCSNFLDFQSRRANIKFRSSETGKPTLCHTINGSGLAVGRTLAAILENYQLDDTTVEIPEALQDYMNHQTEITLAHGCTV